MKIISSPVTNHDRLHHSFEHLDRARTRTGWFKERGRYKVLERLRIRLELGEGQGVSDDSRQLDQVLPVVVGPDSMFTSLGFRCPLDRKSVV